MSNIIWQPQQKQLVFMMRAEDEGLYGGAAGGGKSESLVIEAARQVDIPHYKGLVLRKTYADLSELIEKSERYYPAAYPKARFNETKLIWTFPSGAKVQFGGMQYTKDKTKYQGKAYDFIGFDELTHFTFEEYIYLKSRNRPNGPGTRCYMRNTANPGGVGHQWVKERFITAGEPLKTIWEKVDIVHPDGHIETQWMSRVFVPSTVFDNEILLRNDPKYLGRLASMPEKERNALLYGDWDTYEGQFFEEFRVEPDMVNANKQGIQTREEAKRQRRWCHVIDPFTIPSDWKIYRSFDWGSRRPFSCAWWAVDFDGVAYRILEFYGCTGTPNEGVKWPPDKVFSEIHRIETEHEWLKGKHIIGVADPAIWNADTGKSIAEMAADQHVFFNKGDHERLAGWEQMRYRFAFDDNGFPMVYVFKNCEAFIRTIPTLQHDEHKIEDVDTDGEDHPADEARYFFMSRPIKPRIIQKEDKFREGNLHLFLDINREDLTSPNAHHRMERVS